MCVEVRDGVRVRVPVRVVADDGVVVPVGVNDGNTATMLSAPGNAHMFEVSTLGTTAEIASRAGAMTGTEATAPLFIASDNEFN